MPRVKKSATNLHDAPFATRLRELLAQPDVSQTKLADFVGVTRQAISSYSLGTSVPDMDRFERISEFFEVSADYLLGKTDVKQVDLSLQDISNKLGLSEGAINCIIDMGRLRTRYDPVEGVKFSHPKRAADKQTFAFSQVLESGRFSAVMEHLLSATQLAQGARDYMDAPTPIDAKVKENIKTLQKEGLVVLSVAGSVDYHIQQSKAVYSEIVEEIMQKGADEHSKHNQKNK